MKTNNIQAFKKGSIVRHADGSLLRVVTLRPTAAGCIKLDAKGQPVYAGRISPVTRKPVPETRVCQLVYLVPESMEGVA